MVAIVTIKRLFNEKNKNKTEKYGNIMKNLEYNYRLFDQIGRMDEQILNKVP